MKSKGLLLAGAIGLALLGALPPSSSAATPSDYPSVLITDRGGAAPGNWIGTLGGGGPDGSRTYYVVLDNTGTNPVYASATNEILRFVTSQGYATATDSSGFRLKNERFEIVDTFTTLGYGLDTHDVKLLPNGHALLLGSENRSVNGASATGSIIQEIDAQKRLVFEWHSLDHLALTDSLVQGLDYTHVNAVTLDPIDNHLLVSFRHTSEIVKISRSTGEVLWRLGGKMNQFMFVNEHEENAPYYTLGQHDVHRLANGNLLFFDNGNLTGASTSIGFRSYSRVVEYALDEASKIATLVWEYRHAPDIQANCEGAVKRLANGNTLIDWGCASGLRDGTIVTEVNAQGQIVFEMTRRATNGAALVGMRSSLTKSLWTSADLVRSSLHQDLQEGRTYDSPEAGLSVTVNRLTGAGNATLTAQRHLSAVRSPQFSGSAPQVLMEYLTLLGSNVSTWEAVLCLDLPDTRCVFDTPMIHDPAQVTVYHRATPGKGRFLPLPTSYDAATQKARVTTTQLGEFVFAYPDVAQTPQAPLILRPADESAVNYSQPLTLAWSPQGLVGSFDLQVAADPGFSNLALHTNGLGAARFTLQALLPETRYSWRVRTVNEGGVSDWATASFTTEPPELRLTSPAGGEVWQRYQVVTIRWTDNLAENVALDLYKGGVSNRTFVASTASSGFYTWTVGQFADIPPGTDYTLKIRSTADPAVFDFSEPFSVVRPVTLTTRPAGLSVTVDGTLYTAPVSFAWAPGSSHLIHAPGPQLSADGHSRYAFDSWSDGGAQNHAITASLAGATNTASFLTNYLLDITVTPPAAATVKAIPAGPWHPPGARVSLQAHPAPGYQFDGWQGVDAQTNESAQLAMNGYRAVEATLLPLGEAPVIRAGSLVVLPGPRVQFALWAGSGVATQATVWGASTLAPADWRKLGTVTLTSGRGVFTEDSAPTGPTRFYKVTLP